MLGNLLSQPICRVFLRSKEELEDEKLRDVGEECVAENKVDENLLLCGEGVIC